MSAWVTIVGGKLADTGAAPTPSGMRLFAVDNEHKIHLTPAEMREWRDVLTAALDESPSSWRVLRDDDFVGGAFDRDTAERVARSLGRVVWEDGDAHGLTLHVDFGDEESSNVRRVTVRAVA